MSQKKKALYELERTTRPYTFYKYMPAKWLAEFLAQDTLKATELATVNDPLEWRPQFADPTQETAWQQHQQQASPIHVLCLSSKISTTAMWGHYADAHKGVALAFSLPLGVHDDDSNTRHNLHPTARCYPIGRLKKGTTWLMKVTYTPTRPPIDPKNSAGTAHKLITSKGTDWTAESEYRILLGNNIKHKQDGTPVYIGMSKHLSGIILGTACPAETENEIRAQLKKHNLNIPVVRASLHLTDYRIIAPPFEDTNTQELDNWTLNSLITQHPYQLHEC